MKLSTEHISVRPTPTFFI